MNLFIKCLLQVVAFGTIVDQLERRHFKLPVGSSHTQPTRTTTTGN